LKFSYNITESNIYR